MDTETFDRVMRRSIDEEIAALEFYREAARKVADPGLKAVFEDLAHEEEGHRDILERLRVDPLARVEFGRVPDFRVSESQDVPSPSLATTPSEAFHLAMKKEEEAMRVYRGMAGGCSDPEIRKVFLELAEMERGHKAKLEDLFVNAAYPESW